jgi:hypothetical protein
MIRQGNPRRPGADRRETHRMEGPNVRRFQRVRQAGDVLEIADSPGLSAFPDSHKAREDTQDVAGPLCALHHQRA